MGKGKPRASGGETGVAIGPSGCGLATFGSGGYQDRVIKKSTDVVW